MSYSQTNVRKEEVPNNLLAVILVRECEMASADVKKLIAAFSKRDFPRQKTRGGVAAAAEEWIPGFQFVTYVSCQSFDFGLPRMVNILVDSKFVKYLRTMNSKY